MMIIIILIILITVIIIININFSFYQQERERQHTESPRFVSAPYINSISMSSSSSFFSDTTKWRGVLPVCMETKYFNSSLFSCIPPVIIS